MPAADGTLYGTMAKAQPRQADAKKAPGWGLAALIFCGAVLIPFVPSWGASAINFPLGWKNLHAKPACVFVFENVGVFDVAKAIMCFCGVAKPSCGEWRGAAWAKESLVKNSRIPFAWRVSGDSSWFVQRSSSIALANESRCLSNILKGKLDDSLAIFNTRCRGSENVGSLDTGQMFSGFDRRISAPSSVAVRDARLVCLDCSDLTTRFDLPLARTPQLVSREPKCGSEGSHDQCKESRDRLPVRFKKFARADLSPSERAEDEGNTFFRLIIGTLVIGLIHALLKRVGKPNDQQSDGYTQKGNKP